jgi:methyl-accepting chemotaxis protein
MKELFKNMKIGGKLAVLVGLMSVLLVTTGVYLLHGISETNKRLNMNMTLAEAYTKAAGDADDAEIAFKKQVQEWKDMLLRGNDPKLFTKYRDNFLKKEAEVQSRGKDLKDSLAKLNVDTTRLDEFLKAHALLGEKYHGALKSYRSDNIKSFTIVDVMVRGIDREPTEIIDSVAEKTRKQESEMFVEVAKKSAESYASAFRNSLIFMTLGIGLGIFLSLVIIRTITIPLNDIVVVANKTSEGDLSHDVTAHAITDHTNDEIGMMTASFNRMIEKLRKIVGDINSTTSTLASSSEELSATSDNLNKGTQELSTQTSQVVTAMTEVSQTIMDMAKNATSAADASRNASETASKGKLIVDTTAEDMVKIAQTVQEAASTIEELGKSSAQIGEIVTVINGIAEQTNLLALNAAIEAARAGEQGRGFAVVADEVRKLAERTGQATKDITHRITTIQEAAASSVEAMKKGSDEVDRGVSLAKEASSSLDMIVEASNNAMDMVQRIATATEQQSSAAEEVTQSMEGIAGITNSTSASTEQIKSSAADLARLATELKETASWFRLNGSAPSGFKPEKSLVKK